MHQHTERLAAVTCFFNPHQGRRRVEIFGRFAAGLKAKAGIDLYTIEATYPGQPSQIASTWRVEVDPDSQIWLKENLLNIAINRLPDDCDAVIWIDADVLYYSRDLRDKVLDALRERPVVQPWSEIRYLDRANKPVGSWRPSMAWYNRRQRRPTADPRHSFPGMAWAARRETLTRIGGQYDRCITGGGDVAWACGAWGDGDVPYTKHWSPALIDDVIGWGKLLAAETGGKVGVVEARAAHLYHGQLGNRQYVRRNHMLGECGFDPREHLEYAPNGVLRWSPAAPEPLRTAVRTYLHSRREDD